MSPMSRAGQRATSALRTRIAAGWLVVAFGLGACATDDGGGQPAAVRVVDTVALGELPSRPERGAPSIPPNLVPTTTTTTLPPVIEYEAPIGELVSGNRVLVIGDGVLVATADDSGGQLCTQLVDAAGWTVGLAAESGTTIEYGAEVLDAVYAPAEGRDWDVVFVLLGNIFDGELEAFAAEVDALLERLAPRPVVLFTLTEADNEGPVNELYRARAEATNVLVVDWAELSAAESGTLLRSGGPLPTRVGSDRLVELMAEQLGDAPAGLDAECLPTSFLTDPPEPADTTLPPGEAG